MKIFSNPGSLLLKRSLDVFMRHHRNIAENVANLNVPGYQRKPTRFLDVLTESHRLHRLRTSDSRHVAWDQGEEQAPEWEKGRVEIPREMADLALNQVRYDFASRVLRRKFDGLTQSITGRIR